MFAKSTAGTGSHRDGSVGQIQSLDNVICSQLDDCRVTHMSKPTVPRCYASSSTYITFLRVGVYRVLGTWNVERYAVETTVEMGGARGTAWKSPWKREEPKVVETAGGGYRVDIKIKINLRPACPTKPVYIRVLWEIITHAVKPFSTLVTCDEIPISSGGQIFCPTAATEDLFF
ncbi:hypothetical protein OUZ56_003181 [Daphnia magna]|uniref:Uncharacterized protein n=1 Tax=Daphnia magna TaxID=35525 RepID=A0ABR0A7Z5_9CRUS|nr:hypothetical protein OUZ56_003181 [Daphnia magna]